MITFTVLKQSKTSNARLGVLETPHGAVETPAFVPVATNAAVKALTVEQVLAAKSQILIANTFHLHLRPGEKIVKKAGGLHAFMQWSKPLMTDSGGFQVFSLGFGADFHSRTKIAKYFPAGRDEEPIRQHSQPQRLRITSDGVHFRALHDGRPLFLGPRESIAIQEALGADIMFAFDECTSPFAARAYIRESLARTHEWAKLCLAARKTDAALFGIVQGSRFKDFREESARYINALGFDGFGIGGDLGASKQTMYRILRWVIPCLDRAKPRHLLGIGHLEDMAGIVKAGIDLFDCTTPTQYARRGIAFTSAGKLNMRQAQFLRDKKPIDGRCACMVCAQYQRSYLAHLVRAKEIGASVLLTFHNLHFFNTAIETLREKIKRGLL